METWVRIIQFATGCLLLALSACSTGDHSLASQRAWSLEELHRLGGAGVSGLFERIDIAIRETDVPACLRQSHAEANSAFGANSYLQNGAHLGFRAAIVLSRTNFKGAVRLFG